MKHKAMNRIEGAQKRASDPTIHAALSASAGTGKTTVLTARVLRLLLRGARPNEILCLTFTRAAAAEMANRISAQLARWVRASDQQIMEDLHAIGEGTDRENVARARTLFATLLDTPGGLRIQTIHAFSQSLLSSFPSEAGIAPGFEAIDEVEADELTMQVMADLAQAASESALPNDRQFLNDLGRLSLRLGQDGAVGYLKRAAGHRRSLAQLGDLGTIVPMLREMAGLPTTGDPDAVLEAALADIDHLPIERLIAANRAWGTKTGKDIVARLEAFRHADAATRVGLLDDLGKGIVTAKDELCQIKPKQEDAEPDYAALAQAFADWLVPLRRLPKILAWIDDAGAGLRAGRRFADAFARAKAARGKVDFDDLIDATLELLGGQGINQWVAYKLDQRIDHILVDEAQDNNEKQWKIVIRLADEFFSGNADSERDFRTLFMVGDFKQSIYSFQGSEPRQFREVTRRFAERVAAAEGNEAGQPVRAFEQPEIARSFRSSPAILHVVDQTIATLGHDAMGLESAPAAHDTAKEKAWGKVEIWPPFEGEEDEEEVGDGEETWLDLRARRYADALAARIAAMVKGEGGCAPVPAGDILILLRRRSELASLIVARLFLRGVKVAGVDRLYLTKPLAVRDLLAAMRFASNPNDDLSLACLLVGPLFGWSPEQLQDLALGRRDRLWDALRDDDSEAAVGATASLRELLAAADFVTPAAFFEQILSGPLDGRRRLMARLGADARDPIDELMNTAYAFERRQTPSFDAFLAQLDADESEVKREADGKGDQVRVMTVHGSKGLEAPLVILADATWDPDRGAPRGPLDMPTASGLLPLPRPSKDERTEPFASRLETIERLEREEHWRLLYVALTRAERHLVMAGTMPKNGKLNPDCWHVRVREAMEGMDGTVASPNPLEQASESLCYEMGKDEGAKPSSSEDGLAPDLPAWLRTPAPQERTPPRPLSPSSVEEVEELVHRPPDEAMRDAALRGVRIHKLLERLPQVDAVGRRAVASTWLERAEGVEDAAVRDGLIDAALTVIDHPDFAALFGPDAMAEAPLAATLADGRVVAGTVDRLLVTPDEVQVVDFKTGLFVPNSIEEVPAGHRRQMETYRDALSVIFPQRRVTAFLLYTAEPRLVAIP